MQATECVQPVCDAPLCRYERGVRIGQGGWAREEKKLLFPITKNLTEIIAKNTSLNDSTYSNNHDKRNSRLGGIQLENSYQAVQLTITHSSCRRSEDATKMVILGKCVYLLSLVCVHVGMCQCKRASRPPLS